MKPTMLCAFVLVASAVAAVPALAQQSRCADCHYSRPEAPAQDHLMDWDRSPHGRQNVGCEKCHGGDATSFEPFIAHRGILSPANPASPVSRSNLPATCGGCHAGPFAAFQASKHYEMQRAGDLNVPTCATCHGNTAAWLLSPKALEGQCNQCHGAGKIAPRPERAQRARQLLEGVVSVREQLQLARGLINHVDDRTRRAELQQAYDQAQVPLTEAIDAGHKFVFDRLEERLGVARGRATALLSQVINPARRP
jgi:hypothetical protein